MLDCDRPSCGQALVLTLDLATCTVLASGTATKVTKPSLDQHVYTGASSLESFLLDPPARLMDTITE